MTEPSRPRPVPGPPRPAGTGAPATAPGAATTAAPSPAPLAGLDGRPVTEHVAAFEAEYDRLERELATIDRL